MNKILLGQMITVATPVLVPVITLFVKSKVLPFLNEKHKWLTPLIAIALGGGLDYVNGLITGISLGPFGGAALGSFGVILRELKDQFQKNP